MKMMTWSLALRTLCPLLAVATCAAFANADDAWQYKSDWQTSSCYSGLDWKYAVKKPFFRDSKTQEAWFKVRNRYPKRVWFSYEFKIAGKDVSGRTSLGPGDEASGGMWASIPVGGRRSATAKFSRVTDDPSSEDYAQCDR